MSNASDSVSDMQSVADRPVVLMLAPLFPPAYRGGGPIRTTEAMVETHGDRFCFYVVTSDTDWGESVPLDVATDTWVTRGKARVMYTRAASIWSLLRALRLGAELTPDFVYINSFLSPKFSILPVLLSRVGFFGRSNIVVAPRGEFGIAALSIKSRKKRVFLTVSRMVSLHSRVTWHASSEIEASEIREWLPSARIRVRLNESTLPGRALRRVEPCTDEIKLVYVSRISEIKGLTLLLEALTRVESRVSLDVYGTAQNPVYLRECQALADRMPGNVTVRFNGSVDNSSVRPLFKAADAFFLPTEHENFGHAIAESLSAGCPVFIEDVTPWSDVVRAGGGRIVNAHTVEAWRQAVHDFCSAPSSVRTEMKTRAADAYEKWRSSQEGPAIFDLVIGQRELRR